MHSQQSASAPEGGWLPGARPASAASRLFGQRPGAYPVGAGQGEPGRVAAERQQRLCSQRAGHRFRTKTRAARVGNEARGAYMRTQRQAQACVGYFFAVREGSSPAMRCHGGARICRRTYERDALQGGARYHGQPIRICRQKYDDCCRHSVMLHRSGIPSLRVQIERTMMKCHDQRGNEPPFAGLPSGFAPLYVPFNALLVRSFKNKKTVP
jgi:hypothetical protein